MGVGQKRQKPQKGLIPTSHHLCSLQTCIISSCLCSTRSFQQLPTAPRSKPRPFPGIRTAIHLILSNLPALLLPTRPHGPDCSHPGFSLKLLPLPSSLPPVEVLPPTNAQHKAHLLEEFFPTLICIFFISLLPPSLSFYLPSFSLTHNVN